MEIPVTERQAKKIRRREILKLSPVVLLGAFAIPSLRETLLTKGLAFHDWAASQFFRKSHLAPTFSDAEVVPFEKFPINDYDVDDPGVDLAAWKLKVSGDVANPGEYTLEQIQALPRQRQNTRHILRRGVGRHRALRRREGCGFSAADWREHAREICFRRMRGRLLHHD